MMQCKHCKKEITGRKRTYCNEGCSDKYFAEKAANERKIENKKKPVRYCRYEKCGKPLPSDTKRSYCPLSDCYSRQNRLEAKRKRDKTKTKRKFKICNNPKCGKEFRIEKNKYRQDYCSPECKIEATTKKCPHCDKRIGLIYNACFACASVRRKPRVLKTKEDDVPKEKYLVRGKISYPGYREL